MPSQLPEPGQIVIVRQRPFVVNDIETSTLPLPSTVQDQSARQHLLRLSSMEDEGLGEELAVVCPSRRTRPCFRQRERIDGPVARSPLPSLTCTCFQFFKFVRGIYD